MKTYSFFAMIHQDRFSDLALIVGDALVAIEPFSFGDDHTFEVIVKGDAETTRRLDRAVQSVKHILSSPLVFEEA